MKDQLPLAPPVLTGFLGAAPPVVLPEGLAINLEPPWKEFFVFWPALLPFLSLI